MKKITLTNEFHQTAANVVPIKISDGRFGGLYKITAATARRLRRSLCGVSGCCCGGNFGERGGVHLHVVTEDYDGNYIIEMEEEER